MSDTVERRKRGLQLTKAGNRCGLPEMRWAVLGTFTLDLLPPLLVASLNDAGFYSDIYLGGFNQLSQEILDDNSGLYRFDPQNVLVVTALEDLLSDIYARNVIDQAGQDEQVDLQMARLEQLVERLLEQLPEATLYLVTPTLDRVPGPYVLDPTSGHRGQLALERFLARFRELGHGSSRVVIVDWEWHIRSGRVDSYNDERLWYTARMRLSPDGLAALSELVGQYVAAHHGRSRKVAVVDLDNTLWGGIVGEDGVAGLELGQEGLGLAYQDFQRELLRLHDLGVLLAICSKNNPSDAWDVFDQHPSMVLRREHFAATRVNWNDKVTNLEELATELNLGLDSFVFFDDSQIEREWVSSKLTEVLVPGMPGDPARRPDFIRRLPDFQRLGVTAEDMTRPQMYKEQAQREQALAIAYSLDEFLEGLDQEAEFQPLRPEMLERAAQMCQRTNQFNLTTPRYTAGDLEQMVQNPLIEAYTIALRDRIGDNGVTGLAILRFDDSKVEVDTFLLSCRVIGRRLENAILAFLAERTRQRGARSLVGRYIPTKKNGLVADLYTELGFAPADQPGAFEMDLTSNLPEYPGCIRVHAQTAGAPVTA